MIRDAPILILDEPTTGLDAESGHRVLEPLRRLMTGRTAIIISHNLLTVRHADALVVLDHGVVVERGSHDALLALGGRYADPPIAPALGNGAQLAPGYEIIEHISRNQALDVYDVWDRQRYCRCIAKTLRPDRSGEPRATARLEQEGRLLAKFTHPHIVRAYETLRAPQPIVILETLSGETLSAMIERRARGLARAELALLGLHLGSAVRYMRRQGYLHLNLKPSNVIIDQGLAKLLDLSLARPPGAGRRGAGTPCYMAPEQARGEDLTAATDVWGLGAVLFEASTREPPFPDIPAIKYPQLEGTARRVADHRRLPGRLARSIDACLSPLPSDRSLVDDLLAILEQFA